MWSMAAWNTGGGCYLAGIKKGEGFVKSFRFWLAAMALAAPGAALAHHSFAVFFDPEKSVTVTGVVTSFRFTNPHGLITLDVKKPDGSVEHWRAETNAPVILVRRGWTRDIIKPGETVTITGWPSRDGTTYMRLQGVKDADGKTVGTAPFGRQDQN
jgi:hypothetical protein